MKTVLDKMWPVTAEVKDMQGEDKKGGGGAGREEIKIINSFDELCTCCLGTGQLFGHCLCEGGQTTEWGEGLEGGCVQKKTKATGHMCTDIHVWGSVV